VSNKWTNADDVVKAIYHVLQKQIDPQTLDKFIRDAMYARGSRSVHGFILAIRDLHEQQKLRRSA